MADAPTVVVGAGPAGLAAAAMLRRRGVDVLVLECEAELAASWRRHYRSLRLHTIRSLSSLPGMPLPRSSGRWVTRADLVEYLDRYASEHRLPIQTGTAVHRVDAVDGGLRLVTAAGPIDTTAVVIATGYNRSPVIPEWPGRGQYRGQLIHSRDYRSADPYRDRRVLVVGAGNSGADIALDLARGGARQVWLSVRSPTSLVPRQAAGLPAQVAAIPLARTPPGFADAIARLERRVFVGDLTGLGLAAGRDGVFRRHRRDGALPILDAGFAAGLRAGLFRIVPAVEALDVDAAVLQGGARLRPDAIVAATGYRPGLDHLVGHLGVLGSDGVPLVHGGATHRAAPGVHFTGFRNPITGALRELRFEAPAIASAIA